MVHSCHFVCHFAWSRCFFYALLTLMSFQSAANACVVIASLAIHCAKLLETANLQTSNVNKKHCESLCETMDQHIYWTCVSLVITHPLFKCITSPSFFSFGLSGRQGSVHLQRSAVGCQAKRWWSPNKRRNAECLQLRCVNWCQLGQLYLRYTRPGKGLHSELERSTHAIN